jgi:hypothetical protein
MKVKSKLPDGGYHPASGATLPPAGQAFEVDEATGAALVAAGLATGEKAAAKVKEDTANGKG